MKAEPLRVLVVEDNKHDYELVQHALINNNNAFETSWAQSRKVLNKIYAEGKFDILILDMTLPDATGLEILQEFSEKNFNIPIIFNTGSSTIKIAVQAMQLGATDFVVKDVEGEYIKILPEVIRKARALG